MGIFDGFKSMFETKLNVDSRFEILREAISGTMSSFYMARDKKSDEVVGLKILDIEKTNHFESRFKGLDKPLEGEISSQFDHPLIVKTLDFGMTNKGEHYVLMEFLDGPGLNSLITDRSPLLEMNRISLIRQMVESVKIVHEAGYIHRDICPRNFICLNDATSLKLIDFGLTVPATNEFMQPGNRTGTPNYMAPEVVRRRATDQRLDIFSLGVTCYQMIALQLPWPGQDVTGKAAMSHDTKPPVPLTEVVSDVEPTLANAIMQCLNREPAARPQSAEDLLRAISMVRTGS